MHIYKLFGPAFYCTADALACEARIDSKVSFVSSLSRGILASLIVRAMHANLG